VKRVRVLLKVNDEAQGFDVQREVGYVRKFLRVSSVGVQNTGRFASSTFSVKDMTFVDRAPSPEGRRQLSVRPTDGDR